MRIVKLNRDSKRDLLANLLKRSTTQYPEYEAKVAAIVGDVKERGDEAVFEYTKKFDKAELSAANVEVATAEIEEAYNHAVLVGKEGLAGILCANDASLDVGTIVKLIAQRVTIAVSQIAVSVALSFVEGNMACGHHRVFAVFHDVMKGWKVGLLPGYFAHIGEKRQQGYLLIVE